MRFHRWYRWMADDNFNGLFGHEAAELINRRPVLSRLVQLPRAQQMVVGRRSASVKMGKRFLEKLQTLGIK